MAACGPARRGRRARRSRWVAAALALAGGWIAAPVQAWSLGLVAAPRRVFLHVGNGVLDGPMATVNRVELAVPAASLGSGVPLTMGTTSTQSRSLLDGYPTCPSPATQVLVGAAYRRSNAANGPASATLSVTSPTHLVSAAGDTLPVGQIRWSVSAPGSPVPTVIPAGAFTGGTQTLATVPANTYIENCHLFTYANTGFPAAGTYEGRVTYTLSSP